MASDPKKPTEFSSIPQFSGDRPSVPAAVELDSATAWAEFERLRDGKATEPAPPGPATDPAFAPTEPAGLTPTPQPPRERPKPQLTVQEVMVEARRFNRVCPKPDAWQRLYELLPPDSRTQRAAPTPISGAAWQATSAMPKRMRLRDQVEWAEQHGGLQQVMDFLKSLPEAQWHHMGD